MPNNMMGYPLSVYLYMTMYFREPGVPIHISFYFQSQINYIYFVKCHCLIWLQTFLIILGNGPIKHLKEVSHIIVILGSLMFSTVSLGSPLYSVTFKILTTTAEIITQCYATPSGNQSYPSLFGFSTVLPPVSNVKGYQRQESKKSKVADKPTAP